MNPEEASLAREALRAGAGCARRLVRSQRVLAPQFPLSPTAVGAMTPEVEDDLDAFIKRYEQLVGLLNLA